MLHTYLLSSFVYSLFAGNIFIHHVHRTEEWSGDDGYDDDMDCISPLEDDQIKSSQMKRNVHSVIYKIGMCWLLLFNFNLSSPAFL